MAILAYFFFSSPYSVKTTSLPHTPNDLFNQICRKGVPFGRLVQTFLTPILQPPEIWNFPLLNAVFRKNRRPFTVVVAPQQMHIE